MECSYQSISDCCLSASTHRHRRHTGPGRSLCAFVFWVRTAPPSKPLQVRYDPLVMIDSVGSWPVLAVVRPHGRNVHVVIRVVMVSRPQHHPLPCWFWMAQGFPLPLSQSHLSSNRSDALNPAECPTPCVSVSCSWALTMMDAIGHVPDQRVLCC